MDFSLFIAKKQVETTVLSLLNGSFEKVSKQYPKMAEESGEEYLDFLRKEVILDLIEELKITVNYKTVIKY